MKIIVLGSGVLGVTTAYFLSKRGHKVTVIDRQPESARETSFANGGQLSYGHAEPWASPASLKKAIKWLGKKDAPLLFSFRLDYHMWKWTLGFLRNCTNERVRENTKTMLRLGLYSREVLHKMQDQAPLDFHYIQRGILHIFKSQDAFDAAVAQAEFQKGLGAPFESFSPEECIKKEPALEYLKDSLVGGIYSSIDESADVFAFTQILAGREGGSGVSFSYNTVIRNILTEGGKVIGIETDKGIKKADAYVVSLGSYSPIYLRKIGVKVPIYPMKGYSISVPIGDHKGVPEISITDQAEKVVFSRLGKVFRAAGTAEFAGYDHSIKASRIKMLKDVTRRNFPDCGDIDNAAQWACLRPSTPDGPPILGKCKYDNLFLSTGNGTLGWTQAPGSAKIVADIIEGKEPEIDMTGLTIDRY